MSFDWINSLPAPEKAEEPPKKERNMANGPKALQLPDAVIEHVNTNPGWWSQAGIPDAKAARAFIYAVRTAAKKNGNGLKIVIDAPENVLLKDLANNDLTGPFTLRLNTAEKIDTRRGWTKEQRAAAKAAEESSPVPTEQPKTEAELALENGDEDFDTVLAKFTSPGAFVDPDATPDPRDEE